MSAGRFPLSRLDLRLMILTASSLPSVFDGMVPTSPTPGSRTLTTRVLSSLQVMPTHDSQTEVVGFHVRFRRWGIALAKSRRACLSELRSAITKGKRITMTKRKEMSEVEGNFMASCFLEGIIQWQFNME